VETNFFRNYIIIRVNINKITFFYNSLKTLRANKIYNTELLKIMQAIDFFIAKSKKNGEFNFVNSLFTRMKVGNLSAINGMQNI